MERALVAVVVVVELPPAEERRHEDPGTDQPHPRYNYSCTRLCQNHMVREWFLYGNVAIDTETRQPDDGHAHGHSEDVAHNSAAEIKVVIRPLLDKPRVYRERAAYSYTKICTC